MPPRATELEVALWLVAPEVERAELRAVEKVARVHAALRAAAAVVR